MNVMDCAWYVVLLGVELVLSATAGFLSRV